MNPEKWQQVQELYHAALARDSEERAAFVAAACHGDEGLRREVESLLLYHPRAKNFIEQPAGRDLRAPLNAAMQRHGIAAPGGAVGRVLGVYEIQAWIAAGGMGEVYSALDRRLNRHVAVKILPEHLSSDPDRRQRFTREAMVISSLNHPHICTLYDVGTQDGVDYLVMEYIDGETLEKRLTRGPLPLPRALEYSVQIADALDRAHRRGVVHRDLKPANVMITGTGVKLLDFGLATRVPRNATGEKNAEEASLRLTREESVIGTPQYSSPEQLQGMVVDQRTDIFSFGVTVYEMMTGHRAFPSDNAAHLVSAILQNDPRPMRELVPDVPPSLERTVFRCFAKDPDERWQTANDLVFELRSIAAGTGDNSDSVRRNRSVPRRVERMLWVATLLAIVIPAVVWTRRGVVPNARGGVTPDVRFSLYPAPGTDFHSGQDVPFALSPDGRLIVYTAVRTDGTKQLWLRDLSSEREHAEPMQGTQGANSPFWSPDSHWIGFFAGNSLKKIRVSNGVVQLIAGNVSTMAGAAWNADDVIVFPAAPNVLSRVSAHGGPVKLVAQGEASYFWPQFLGGGENFLYAAVVPGEIRIGSLKGERPRTLMKFPVRVSSLVYVPGYLFFVQDGTLFARPFDEERLEFSGEPIRLMEGVPVTPPGRAPLSVSASGLLAYWTYTAGTPAVLKWYDRHGRTSEAIEKPAKYVGFSLSPDAGRVAFSRRGSDGGADLWIHDLANHTEVQLTFDKAAYAPQWSPDGSRIVFAGPGRAPPPKLFVKSLVATAGPDMQVGPSSAPNFASSWNSEGNTIISVRIDAPHRNDLWVQRLHDKDGERLPVNTAANESHGKFSPDDRWLAYVTDQSGKDEVWLADFPSGNIRRQVSIGGGTSPAWGRNSSEIFYVSDDKRLMAAPVNAGRSAVIVGASRVLFAVENLVELDQFLIPAANSYAAAPDGQRFLVAVRARDTNVPPIRVVVNWRALLKH